MQIVQVLPALFGCIYRVHLGICTGSLMLRTCLNAGSGHLVVRPLLLSSLLLLLGALLANMALFRVLKAFLARFGAFVWVCVACVLCVACGAFVRVNS